MGTDPGQLDQYAEAGWDLIPLHRHDHVDGRGRERGKSPLHRDWTTRAYAAADVRRALGAGRNAGARPRDGQLVVDVDPRRFPDGETLETDNPLSRLAADCGLDPAACPAVRTGSGGLHLYLRTPPGGARLLDSLGDYPGVEFKGPGRQVVTAGSLHPSGGAYRWLPGRPRLRDAPEAPERLLAMLRRPQASTVDGGGDTAPERLAEMLDRLDVLDFADELRWRELMMACHHATGGEGREEFLEWSAGDPAYAGARGEAGARWDSLSARRAEGMVTQRFLHKLLINAGAEALVPRTPAAEDFADEEVPEDAGEPADERNAVERMNDLYCCVLAGSQYRVMWEEWDPELERTMWRDIGTGTFREMLLGQTVQKEKADGSYRAVEVADEWLKWRGRRRYNSVVFDPEREHEGHLNLWTGWGVDARRGGSWEILRELLFECLCAGDEAVYRYAMDWCSHMVQHPGSPGEVALCFKGPKGSGKSTFGDALARLAGKHGLSVTSPELLTGRFNGHLRDLVFLHADEAFTPHDRAAESRLKGLITQKMLAYEAKGRDALAGRNRLHVVMSSNERWVVPAGLEDERRFMVQDVRPSRRRDKAFFDALYAELEAGGYEAMLKELQTRPLGGFHPRDSVPDTAALAEQKEVSMGPVLKWWHLALEEGELPFETQGEWWMGEILVPRQDVVEAVEEYCRRRRLSAGYGYNGLETAVGMELKRALPGAEIDTKMRAPEDRPDLRAHSDGRLRAYRFPSLSQCRRSYERILGVKVDWGP